MTAGGASAFTGEFRLEDGLLTDESGRKIELKRPFTRIISLYGAHTENLFALGLDREIIGVTRQDRAHLPPARTKPGFSYHDDPEKFLAARPDLVLIRPMIDRGYARLMKRLEQSGITVVSLQPREIPRMLRYWAALGALTGKEDAAHGMIRRFCRALTAFSALAARISPKKRVYFEAMHKQMKTVSKGSMADAVLTAAGGINIADDAEPSRGTNIAVYGKERILARAREIDVFLAQSGAMNRPTRELIMAEPGFSVIRAIRNQEVYIIDETIVSRPTMRLLTGIHRIGSLLYPDTGAGERGRILREADGPDNMERPPDINNKRNPSP